MSPEVSIALQIGGVWVGATALSILGHKVGDRVCDIVTQSWEKKIEAEARKMPPIVITQPTAPHIIDFDSPYPSA